MKIFALLKVTFDRYDNDHAEPNLIFAHTDEAVTRAYARAKNIYAPTTIVSLTVNDDGSVTHKNEGYVFS